MWKVFPIIITLLLSSCGIAINTKNRLSRLDLDMGKNDVISCMGEPDTIRGSMKNEQGKIITVWEYNLYENSKPFSNFMLGFFTFTLTWFVGGHDYERYWITFVDNKLLKWGKSGDWQNLGVDLNIKN